MLDFDGHQCHLGEFRQNNVQSIFGERDFELLAANGFVGMYLVDVNLVQKWRKIPSEQDLHTR